MTKSALSVFEFDRFRLDPNQRVLFKDGRPLTLPPKVFQTLLLLVQNQGQVVVKEDFFSHVWSDAVVEESNLTWNIHAIRKSLGETPKRRFIATIPKVGFRFEETVRVLTPSQVSSGTSVRAAKKNFPAEETASIAVLPFLNIGGNSENEYLSDGLTEEVIDVLARIKGLWVAARTSSFAFRGKDVDIRTIADVLGVTFLIEGSVRKSARKVRISARLFGVNQGYIWTDVFESQTENIFDLQENIARSVADNLRVNLGVGLTSTPSHRKAPNADAYNYQLLGRYFWNQRTPDAFRKAVQNFESALRLEPRYALAHAGIADVFNALGLYRMMGSREAFSKAKHAAQMALEIEPDLAEAHTAMGIASTWLDWDWATGEEHFLRALAVKPNYATAHQWYALSLPIVDRIKDGIEEMCTAVQLEPLSLGINATLAWMYYTARDNDRAIQQALITLERDQQFGLAKYYLGLAYAQKNQFPEAIAALTELKAAAHNASARLSAVGFVHARAGEREEATRYLSELRHLSATQHVSAYDMALIYAGLNDLDNAFEWLDRSVEERGWLNYLTVEPMFDSLREDPRFKRLAEKLHI